MLRSFEYTEQPYSEMQLQDDILRAKEMEIARKFVQTHRNKVEHPVDCPICGKERGQYFFTKWGIDYLYCQQCGSVYALCDRGWIEAYQGQEELIELRTSHIYQTEIAARRSERWREFLEWMEIRAFRFIRKNKDLSIVDVGNRYSGYVEMIRQSEFCGQYALIDSILDASGAAFPEQADIVFCFDQLQKEVDPSGMLDHLWHLLKPGGILVLETRAGSGFDILTLKEHNRKIYPYEHITLPSVKGLVTMLEASQYQVLEITTPGVMDVGYVKRDRNHLEDSDLFIKNLMEAGDSVLQEFQRFLQKNGMSSFVRVIARKPEER